MEIEWVNEIGADLDKEDEVLIIAEIEGLTIDSKFGSDTMLKK